jgi:transcriptional regulator with XRE-family HTH domain
VNKSAGELAPVELGARVKALRQARQWTLDQASAHMGLSRAALSKIERNEMSPTFQTMQKLAQGFGLEWVELIGSRPGVASTESQAPTCRRSVTRADEGARYEMPNYGIRLLTGELKNTAFVAAEVQVKARAFAEYKDWDRHNDEDFLFVLAGEMVLHTEHYAPVTLSAGDSVYFDACMGHACVSVGPEDARALWITQPIAR